MRRALVEVLEMKEKVEGEKRSFRRVGGKRRDDVQKASKPDREKETSMAPPTQSLSGNPSEMEEGESQDFDHLAKWEVLKCRLNALKKKQVGVRRRGEKQGE